MFKLSALSDSDIMILGIVAMIFGFILGLLSDVIMRDKGFGPMRNTLIIMAGGAAGMALRANYYPVPTPSLLVVSVVAAVAAATVALALASVVKKVMLS